MVLFWVDGCIFYINESSLVDGVISSLKDKFLLEREEDMAGLIGLQIQHNQETETDSSSQTGLVDKILEATEMDNYNLKYNPIDKIPLHKDLAGSPCCEDWDYYSLVGMLLYLVGSTRPDISYAIHQYTRFSHAPKAYHDT